MAAVNLKKIKEAIDSKKSAGMSKSKIEMDEETVNGKKTTGTLTEAVEDEDLDASYYSKTKEKNGEQKVKTFTKMETEDGPEYSMKKNFKPLLGVKYKEVDKEISPRRGERKMAEMKKFMNK
jgi:uncharacterized protein involved in high-affinity Fe2+ transport